MTDKRPHDHPIRGRFNSWLLAKYEDDFHEEMGERKQRHIGGLRGVVHSYGGSAEQARQLWQMGFLLGIGGPATHDRATRLRALVASMPLEFLLLETDAPDQAPATHRGERNEPSWLPGIAAVVAALRGMEIEMLAAATTRNAQRLFGLPGEAAP